MEELLMFLARGLVTKPDLVRVKISEPSRDGTITYDVMVDSQDVGRLVGKNGKIAKAIRQIVSASDMKKGTKSLVSIREMHVPS